MSDDNTSQNSLIIQGCFSYPGVSVFPLETENWPFKFYEELYCNFEGNCIECIKCFK